MYSPSIKHSSISVLRSLILHSLYLCPTMCAFNQSFTLSSVISPSHSSVHSLIHPSIHQYTQPSIHVHIPIHLSSSPSKISPFVYPYSYSSIHPPIHSSFFLSFSYSSFHPILVFIYLYQLWSFWTSSDRGVPSPLSMLPSLENSILIVLLSLLTSHRFLGYIFAFCFEERRGWVLVSLFTFSRKKEGMEGIVRWTQCSLGRRLSTKTQKWASIQFCMTHRASCCYSSTSFVSIHMLVRISPNSVWLVSL